MAGSCLISFHAVVQDAHDVTKSSRGELANALAEVKANMVITTKQRQKQGLERMLEVLQQLREAAHLHDALRCHFRVLKAPKSSTLVIAESPEDMQCVLSCSKRRSHNICSMPSQREALSREYAPAHAQALPKRAIKRKCHV